MGFITRVQNDRSANKQKGKLSEWKQNALSASQQHQGQEPSRVWVGKGYGDPQTTFAHIDASEIQEGLWEILAPSITCGCPEDARA